MHTFEKLRPPIWLRTDSCHLNVPSRIEGTSSHKLAGHDASWSRQKSNSNETKTAESLEVFDVGQLRSPVVREGRISKALTREMLAGQLVARAICGVVASVAELYVTCATDKCLGRANKQ
jgi:hypothetical protein